MSKWTAFLGVEQVVQVTVRSDVSLGRKIELRAKSAAENAALYGDDYAPRGMGHNLRLEAAFAGATEPIHILQNKLRAVSRRFDHCLLPQGDWPSQQVPTTENIAQSIFKHLPCARLRVVEGLDVVVDVHAPGRARYARSWRINSLHRHHNPDLSSEQNRDLYGKCSAVHGHEYRITVMIEGPIDPVTGLVIARPRLLQAVQDLLVEPFDGQMINEQLGNTSGEIIAARFYERIAPSLPGMVGLSIGETRKNSFYVGPAFT